MRKEKCLSLITQVRKPYITLTLQTTPKIIPHFNTFGLKEEAPGAFSVVMVSASESFLHTHPSSISSRPPKDLGASGNWSWWLSLWKPLTQCFSHSRRYQNPLEERTHSTAPGLVEVGQGWGLWLATMLPLWLGCTAGLRAVWFQTQERAKRGRGFGMACELVRTLNPQEFAEGLRLPSFRLQGDTILEVFCFILFRYCPLWNNQEAAIGTAQLVSKRCSTREIRW